jgi:hypothetical protein
MPYHSILTVLLFSLLVSTQVSAEIWLTDSSYLESQHNIAFNQDADVHTLSQLHVSQILSQAKIQFSGKLKTDNQESESLLNQAKIVTAPLPYFSFTLGRFLINYRQEDLFKTSLGKNQDHPLFKPNKFGQEQYRLEKHYNQGFLTRFQLGFIGQEFSINHYKNEQASYHYRIKIGVPGYKFGPLDFMLEQLPKGYLNQQAPQSLALLGGSLTLPIPKLHSFNIPGAWQWSFQLGKGLKQSTQAWQTSLAWLGFIPKHKLGLMWAETDKDWIYSSDFNSMQSSFQARYQITFSQTLTINATAIKLIKQGQKNEQVLQLAMELSF